jgi:AraC-like DNA-binding protein
MVDYATTGGEHAVAPLTTAQASGSDIVVLNAGWALAAPDYKVGPRVLPFYNVVMVKEGRGTFQWADRSFPLGPGTAFFVFPGIMHSWTTDSEEPLKVYYVALNGRAVESMLVVRIGVDPETPIMALQDHLDELCKLVQQMISQLNSSVDTESVWFVRGYAWMLMSWLLRLGPKASHREKRVGTTIVKRALGLIEAQFDMDMSIDQLAQYLHVSPSYLHGVFRRETGKSPHSYLTEIRIGRSKKLLVDTDLKIEEVASSVGISDPAYFSRLFRRQVGMSPRSFRTQNKTSADRLVGD